MMKMVMISYNSAINSEVMEMLKEYGIENFTKWARVQGKGKRSGPHFATEVWPGENSIIFTAIADEKIDTVLKHIKNLRTTLGKEGLKAFAWNLTDIT